MASANLDLVRSICAPWKHGDYSSVEWADPDIEFELVGALSDGSWKGLAGLAKGWREFLSAWDEHRSEAEEIRELDDERVLVLTHSTGRGKASGMEISDKWTKSACLFHIRSGRVTKLVVYVGRERVLVDLGLAPEAASPPS